MAADVPGSAPGSNLTMQAWSKTIQPGIYDKVRFLQRIKEYERGYVQLNVRKITAGTGHIVPSTDDGTTIPANFDSLTPVNVPITPNWFFTARAYPDSLPWTSGEGIDPAAADDVETSIAAFIENHMLGDVATLTNFLGNAGYSTDAPGYRAALAQLATTGKASIIPGETKIFALLGTLQIDDAMSVPELTHANQRGDGQDPLVSGLISKGYGVNIDFTTLLNSDANGLHGCFWIPEGFGYYWNSQIKGEKQRYLKQTRVMADGHLGHAVIHNARAVDFRTAVN